MQLEAKLTNKCQAQNHELMALELCVLACGKWERLVFK